MVCFLDGNAIFLGRHAYYPPVWDDMRVPANTAIAGSNPPTLSVFVGTVRAWHFSATVVESLHFEAQISHRYKEGTDIQPHIHWSPTSAAAGTVSWGLEYTVATPTVQFPTTSTLSVAAVSGGTARLHQVDGLGTISMAGNKISTMIVGRVYRNAPADTYPDLAVLHEIDFHFQVDTPGSKQPFLK